MTNVERTFFTYSQVFNRNNIDHYSTIFYTLHYTLTQLNSY